MCNEIALYIQSSFISFHFNSCGNLLRQLLLTLFAFEKTDTQTCLNYAIYLGTDPRIKWISPDSLIQYYFHFPLSSLKSNCWKGNKYGNVSDIIICYCLQDVEIKYKVERSLVCGLRWAKKVSKFFRNYALILNINVPL